MRARRRPCGRGRRGEAQVLALLVIGFPVAVGLAWFFEITPEGVRRTVASGDGALFKPQTPDFILAAMLALVLVVAVVSGRGAARERASRTDSHR